MWIGTSSDFITKALDERLYAELVQSTPEGSPGEVAGWPESLKPVARMLQLRAGRAQCWVALEVPMLNGAERADVVLLGQSDNARRIVVIEIKRHQQVRGAGIGAIDYEESPHHPCCQVRGYLRQLLDYDGSLTNRDPVSDGKGAVFMPHSANAALLGHGDTASAKRYNAALLTEHPAFGRGQEGRLAEFTASHLPAPPSEDFVREFRARQRSADRRVSDHIGAILQGNNPYFLRRGPQTRAFEGVYRELGHLAETAGQPWDGKRRVVIVHGPAGSGKSVVAAYAAMKAIASSESGGHGLKDGVFCCTSADQMNTHLLELELAQQEQQQDLVGGRLPLCPICRADFPIVKFDRKGLYYPCDYSGQKSFDPDVADGRVPRESDAFGFTNYSEYCGAWLHRIEQKAAVELAGRGTSGPPFSFILCDEAAGLVDPRADWVDGSLAKAWRMPRGPAVAHLILKSRLSVFFIDDEQGFQQQETTSFETIQQAASDLRATASVTVAEYPLQGTQFRVAGSAAFVDWLDHVPGLKEQVAAPDLPLHQLQQAFKILTSEEVVEEVERLRQRQLEAFDAAEDHRAPRAARVLAGFAWEWRSASDAAALDSEGVLIDRRQRPPVPFRWVERDRGPEFNLGLDLAAGLEWELRTPEERADRFFRHGDPPAVRCAYPLTVRGRDYDHVLVLWGQDLCHDGEHWRVEPKLMFGHPQMQKALSAPRDPRRVRALHDAPRALAMAYRILLTRGMETVRVWIEDARTREYVMRSWQNFLEKLTAAKRTWPQ